MKWLKWFVAGTLAVPLGHQPALWLLNVIGFIHRPVFSMTPTKPFLVPQVISLSFWGGVWGILLGLVLARARGARFWWIAAIFGAIAPTLVAAVVVAPLKGQATGVNAALLMVGLLINAVWGLVAALLYRVMQRR
ncbi:MAG TPA: hypothetical protein VND45_09095 [Thermoanaerobaculia bacterium]|jgi:hypothetical protein|nr:hypothetical protein [Thermoanaerobaculia bacterium]